MKKYFIFLLVFLLIGFSYGADDDINTPIDNEIGFSANITDVPDKGNVQFVAPDGYDNYEWDFGDLSENNSQNPIHYYGSVGSYDVSLTVFNDSSNFTIVKKNYISVFSVNDANSFINPEFDKGFDNWTVQGSEINNEGYYDKCLSFLPYGSGSNLNGIEAFAYQYINLTNVNSIEFYHKTSGKKKVTAFVDDIQVYSKSAKITDWTKVTIDLSAYDFNDGKLHMFKISCTATSSNYLYLDNFLALMDKGNTPNFSYEFLNSIDENPKVQFTDESKGFITGWFWDFGDGTNSTEQNPTHEWTTDGIYTVTLTTFSRDTNSSYSVENLVVIGGPKNNNTNITFASIQDAINNAEENNVIICGEGTIFSNENIIINKNITLTGINGFTLKSKDDSKALITINSGNVIINGFNFIDSKIALLINNGTITITNSSFTKNNNSIIIVKGSLILDNILFEENNNSLSVLDGNVSVKNSNFTENNIALTQSAGNLTLISNIIASNCVGVDITGGTSKINFNNFMNNEKYSLKYNSTDIDASNNWWNTNNPIFAQGTIYNGFADIYYNSDEVSAIKRINSRLDIYIPYIILDVTSDKTVMRNGENALVTVDFTKNNNGEGVNQNNLIPGITFNFESDLKYSIVENDTNYFKFNVTADSSNGDKTFNVKVNNITISVTITLDNTAPAITYITPSARFNDSVTVEILCDDENATIYYTLDGSNPLNSATRLIYTNPFTITESTTVHATAFDQAGNHIFVQMNQATHRGLATIVKENAFIVLSSNVYYTLDGSNPQNGNYPSENSILYTEPFFVDEPTRITFYAYIYDPLGDTFAYLSCVIKEYAYEVSANYLKEVDVNSNIDAIWSQYQGNSNNTGSTEYNGPLSNITQWNIENIVSSASAIIDSEGHIYIAGDDGTLYCLNNQGKIIWSYSTFSKIICTPTIGPDSNIYFTNWMNSTLYCISPNGTLIWKYYLGEYNTGSSPVFGYNNTLYVISGTEDISTLFAFNSNHELIYNTSFPAVLGSTPVLGANGEIYLISAQHELITINYDGTTKSKTNIYTLGYIDQYYLESGSSACVGPDGTIYALNMVQYYYNNVIGRAVHTSVSAYNPDGSVKWSVYRDGLFVYATPSYDDGVVYVIGEKYLLAINADDGSILWQSSLNYADSSFSSPLISGDGIIYITHGDMVYAFNSNGTQLWNYTFTGKYGGPLSLSSPVLSNDGTLIVTTNQGIWAFNDVSADFKWEHINGTHRSIQFTDLSTTGENEYYWDFGDNNTSREQNPIHFYSKDGKYNVLLLVNLDGRVTLVRNATITVIGRDITPPSTVKAFINGEITTGGLFSSTQNVTLYASDDSGTVIIYYTVDGSNPINSSTRREYVEPINIESYTILNMVAVDSSNNYGKVTFATFNIADAIFVDGLVVNSSDAEEIQKIFDEIEDGAKLIFIYDIENANFIINKNLNIITNNNTKITGNGIDPVFTFNSGAENTTLNGFIIENTNREGLLFNNTQHITVKNTFITVPNDTGINIVKSENILVKDSVINEAINGVIVNESNNITLERVIISDSYDNGIWIINSKNTNIVNSTLNANGKNQFESMANQILVDNSDGSQIINNTFNDGFFTIHLINRTRNSNISYNHVYDASGDSMLFEGDYGFTFAHNLIDGAFNGLNFNGNAENVYVYNNVIMNIHRLSGNPSTRDQYYFIYNPDPQQDLYGQEYNCIQISAGSKNFAKIYMENNVFIRQQHRSLEGRHTTDFSSCIGSGNNIWDGSSSYQNSTGAVVARKGLTFVVDRIGDHSYRLRFLNTETGEYVSGLPDFPVIFSAGSYTQTVLFHDSEAVATFDVASSITSIKASLSNQLYEIVSWDIPITEGYSSSNKDIDGGYSAGEAINNQKPGNYAIPSVDPGNGGNTEGDNSGDGFGSGNSHGSGDSSKPGSDSAGVLPDGLTFITDSDNDNNYIIPQRTESNPNTNTNTETETESNINSNNLVQTDLLDGISQAGSGSSASVGVSNTPIAQASSSASSADSGDEGGSADAGDDSKAYEVSKNVDKKVNNDNNAVIYGISLVAVIGLVALGMFGYRRRLR